MTARILLVEDDPTTRAVFSAAITALSMELDAVGTAATARDCVASRQYDLALVDAHLPDGDGADVLAELRGLGFEGPALAHTASNEPALLGRLRSVGFSRVLVKPLAAAELQAAIADALGHASPRVAEREPAWSGSGSPPTWDEGAAMAALGGEHSHVVALRHLFTAELPATSARIEAAIRGGDRAALRGELHRLRASCGFVGAARLASSVRGLDSATDPATALPAFLAAVQDALSPP